jgi:hypothetical protein
MLLQKMELMCPMRQICLGLISRSLECKETRLKGTMSAVKTIEVSLPDGTRKSLPMGATSFDLAQGIGSRLAKAAVAAIVDGKETDLTAALAEGAKLSATPILSQLQRRCAR